MTGTGRREAVAGAVHTHTDTTEASCAVGGGAIGGRREGPRATATGTKKSSGTCAANGGGKRADILRSSERPGATVHNPQGRHARGHRATERRTAPRASTPEPRYTIGGIRESATLSVAQPACSLLTQCAAMQCAPALHKFKACFMD
jgi:hypothetical protein